MSSTWPSHNHGENCMGKNEIKIWVWDWIIIKEIIFFSKTKATNESSKYNWESKQYACKSTIKMDATFVTRLYYSFQDWNIRHYCYHTWQVCNDQSPTSLTTSSIHQILE